MKIVNIMPRFNPKNCNRIYVMVKPVGARM